MNATMLGGEIMWHLWTKLLQWCDPVKRNENVREWGKKNMLAGEIFGTKKSCGVLNLYKEISAINMYYLIFK